MKRQLQDAHAAASPDGANKRLKPDSDRLSSLSNELILRVLQHLDIATVVGFACVSKKFKALSEDSQLWKAAYHARFVAPRLRRVSPQHNVGSVSTALRSWLDEEKLVRVGNTTDWMRQYRLRSNWSTGSCNLAEIPLAAPPIPSLLARLHAGVIVTADKDEGLRAWSYKGQRRFIAQHRFSSRHLTDGARPVSLVIDSDGPEDASTKIAIGFEDGCFGIFAFDPVSREFADIYFHPPSRHGSLPSIALSSNYLLTNSSTGTLSLYQLSSDGSDAPLLLTSQKSHSVWPQLTLTLRRWPDKILACVAYATPWSTTIQELHVSLDGEVLDSRVASSDNARDTHSRMTGRSVQRLCESTCLSYSHPYLLVAHADNTLTLYLVKSSDKGLSMSAGKRLWGHTSSVFGAQVGGRGKAVSVSSKGDEIRVWDLEEMTMGADSEGYSVQVRPGSAAATGVPGFGVGYFLGQVSRGESVTKCWVGFDEENVVVVREQDEARQALAVYDFT